MPTDDPIILNPPKRQQRTTPKSAPAKPKDKPKR